MLTERLRPTLSRKRKGALGYTYYLIDSFTNVAGKGNPAGVVFHDGTLADGDMRAIAGSLDRETAFLHREEGAFRIQFYTAEARIPLCGHDTIAAGIVLAKRGEWTPGDTLVLKSDIGDLPIEYDRADDFATEVVTMTQSAPEFGATVDLKDIAELLDIPLEAVVAEPPPRIVSTGTPFLFARLDDEEVVQSLAPDFDRMVRFLSDTDPRVMGLYVWAHEDDEPTQFHGRCFAPVAGLPEDPVTGSASGALISYWVYSGPGARGRYSAVVYQGARRGRNGRAGIIVDVNEGRVERPRVSGSAVITESGTREWEPRGA